MSLAKIGLFLIRHANITKEERLLFTGIVLRKLGALPLSDIIYTEGESLIVGGRAASIEQMQILRESANIALSNKALTTIRKQVTFQASILASVKAEKTEDMLFARAALWWGQQVEEKLKLLAQRDIESEI